MPTSHPSFIIDAFTQTRFAGNPAAICLIPTVLRDLDYLKIAAEFNLSETAFPVPLDPSKGFKNSSEFSLRWFTPTVEYPLCGHATLATSHVLFNEIGNQNEELKFSTLSGILKVRKDDKGNVEMNFPKYELTSLKTEGIENQLKEKFPETPAPLFLSDLVKCAVPKEIPIEHVFYTLKDNLLFISLHPETTLKQFKSIKMDYTKLLEIDNSGYVKSLGLIVHPKNPKDQGFVDSEDRPFDYAYRDFAPWVGTNEDPATGSAQCAVAPFLSVLTGKTEFYALQAFPGRGGIFRIRLDGDRVILNGSSVTVMRGEIELD